MNKADLIGKDGSQFYMLDVIYPVSRAEIISTNFLSCILRDIDIFMLKLKMKKYLIVTLKDTSRQVGLILT